MGKLPPRVADLEWVEVSAGGLTLVHQVRVLVHVQSVFARGQARDTAWNMVKVNTAAGECPFLENNRNRVPG